MKALPPYGQITLLSKYEIKETERILRSSFTHRWRTATLFTGECRNTMIGGISWHHLSALPVPNDFTDFSQLVSLRVSGHLRTNIDGTKLRLRIRPHPIVLIFTPFLIAILLFCIIGELIFHSKILLISGGVEAVLILSLILFSVFANQWNSEIEVITSWIELVNRELGELPIIEKWVMLEQSFK